MILVAGESLMDMIPVRSGATNAFSPVPGGSPANLAVALGRLGASVGFLCPLSRDPLGRILTRRLEESGVNLDLCPVHDGLATLGFVSAGEPPGYAFYTAGTAGTSLAPEHLPTPLPPSIRAIHTGSLALAVEPFATAILTLVEREADRCFLSLDPNIRPFIIDDAPAFRTRMERLLARSDLIRVSREDLEWMHPGMSPEHFAAERTERGAALVVVTLGTRGALARCPWGVVRVGTTAAAGGDTVGAGDAFGAALLASLQSDGFLDRDLLADIPPPILESALRRAGRAAAINCSRQGCDPPWSHELRPRMPNPDAKATTSTRRAGRQS